MKFLLLTFLSTSLLAAVDYGTEGSYLPKLGITVVELNGTLTIINVNPASTAFGKVLVGDVLTEIRGSGKKYLFSSLEELNNSLTNITDRDRIALVGNRAANKFFVAMTVQTLNIPVSNLDGSKKQSKKKPMLYIQQYGGRDPFPNAEIIVDPWLRACMVYKINNQRQPRYLNAGNLAKNAWRCSADNGQEAAQYCLELCQKYGGSQNIPAVQADLVYRQNFQDINPIDVSKIKEFKIANGKSFLYGDWEELANYEIGALKVRHIRRIVGYDVHDNPDTSMKEYYEYFGQPDKSKIAKKLTCESGYLEILDISGPINEDIHLIVDKALQGMSKCIDKNGVVSEKTKIYMTSGGGYLEDGFELAKVLRKYDVHAVIPWGQYCASSCATAFLGAKIREIKDGANILFHAPYTIKENRYRDDEMVCQKDNEELENFYIEMLGKENGDLLYDRTMKYCSLTDGWTLNNDAASLFGITNNP